MRIVRRRVADCVQRGMRLLPVLLFTLVAAAACRSREPIYGPPFPIDAAYAAPDVAPIGADDELRAVEADGNLATSFAGADLVFVGRVVHVAPSPGVDSGVAVVRQAVLYEVDETWKGRAPDTRVVVRHIYVGTARDPAEPRLNPAIWREGARLVVSANFAPAPGAELHPGGHGLLWLEDTHTPVSVDNGPATERLRATLGFR